MKEKIYEVQFCYGSLDPADDSVEVWISKTDEIEGIDDPREDAVSFFSVSFDVIYEWLADFLNLPIDDQDAEDFVDGVIYPYAERNHYWPESICKKLVADCQKHVRSDIPWFDE